MLDICCLLYQKNEGKCETTIRVARGGEYAPLVIPLPKSVADAMKYEKGAKVHIYTDGERVYIEKLEEPKI